MFLSRKLSSAVFLGEDFQVYLAGRGCFHYLVHFGIVLYCAGLVGYCCCDICNLLGLCWWVAKAIVEIGYSR